MQAAEAAWHLPSTAPEPARQTPSSPPDPAMQVASTDAALLDELRHQRDQLATTVQDLRGRLDFAERSIQAHQQGEAELRRLLAAALQQRPLLEPREHTADRCGATTPSRPWWERLGWWR
jgi:hypothetical protein